MLPPMMVCSDAPMVPSTERERTVTPRTTPSVLTVRQPSIVKAVVVIACSMGCAMASLRSRQFGDDVVVEADEPIQLALDDALLIAVSAEALRTVLDVERRADAVALHPF